MSERIPTDVLVKRLRRHAAWATSVGITPEGSGPMLADDLTALADRLAELAALEPVLGLLAAMAISDDYATLGLTWSPSRSWAEIDTEDVDERVEAETMLAALAALAEAVGGRV